MRAAGNERTVLTIDGCPWQAVVLIGQWKWGGEVSVMEALASVADTSLGRALRLDEAHAALLKQRGAFERQLERLALRLDQSKVEELSA